MPIANDSQLAAAVQRVNRGLQEIQDYLGSANRADGRIRFARGFIRTAHSQRTRLGFVSDDVLRHNLAYALILLDVYRWILVRTDLTGTAREMVIKASIFLAGVVAESLTKDFLRGRVGKQRKFKDRTARLVADGIISQLLCDDLDWVWDTRNNMHVFLQLTREFDHYSASDYNRAVKAMWQLVQQLGTPAGP